MSNTRRYQVITRDAQGIFRFSLLDSLNQETVFEEGQPLDFYFAAANMLERGLPLEEVRELMAVRPASKKCGC